MNTTKLTILIALLSAACAAAPGLFAQPGCKLEPDMTVMLYPQGQEAGKGLPEAGGPGASNGITQEETIDKYGSIGYISDNARFDLYFPEKPNGQMVIVCPGGGYAFVSSYNEGIYVADWMTRRGVTVAVVKYRLPNGHWTVPLTDVQNTFRYCRAHAQEWGIKQIGVMGFSAGGHLAASATTLYTDSATRPDFSILIYPVISMDWAITHAGTRTNLIGQDSFWTSRKGKGFTQWKKDTEELERLADIYSLQNDVTDDTPAVFLAHSSDDTTVPVENSLQFYQALVRAGVPAEMHIFPTGGHGWGFSKVEYTGHDNIGYARSEFEASLARWMDAQLENAGSRQQ